MDHLRLFLVILSCISCVIVSCGHTEKVDKIKSTVKERKDDTVIAGLTDEKEDPVNNEKLAYLIRKKDYSSALDMIKGDLYGGKKEISFEIEYIRAINGMIEEGKKSLKTEDYVSSGNIFSTVIALYPGTEEVKVKVIEKPSKISEYITISSEKLMEEGLSEYREGNLGNAIKTWRKILRFNPGYVQAKNAIETASVQLKKLKSLEGKDK